MIGYYNYQDLHDTNHEEKMENLVDTITRTDNNNNKKVLVSWSELCHNLLGNIKCKLSLMDQARFHAVCKTWHATTSTTTVSSLPWFVSMTETPSFRRDTLEFKTYDPSHLHPKPLSVFTISLTQLFGIRSFLSYTTTIINSSKHGWFFICAKEFICLEERKCRLHFVLFSPLTKKLITLPCLEYPCKYNFAFTFSTDPESPDCVFIIIYEPITVFTLRKGDNEWKFRYIDESVMLVKRIRSNPVYIEGSFYVVSSYGEVVSYSTTDGEFKYESLSTDSLFLSYGTARWFYDDHRVEFTLDGEVMVLFLSPEPSLSVVAPSSIRKFDRTNKIWIPVTNLGDHTLFVRQDNVWLGKVGMDAATRNRLYYFYEHGCCVYSLENGELLQVKSILAPIWKWNQAMVTPCVSSLDSDCDVLLEQIYNRVFREGDYYDRPQSIFWLEPPVIA